MSDDQGQSLGAPADCRTQRGRESFWSLVIQKDSRPLCLSFFCLCYFLMGWASEEELLAHLEKLRRQDAATKS
jgi:hypothetical protein